METKRKAVRNHGVLASLEPAAGGKVRLVLKDGKPSGTKGPATWQVERLYTSLDLDKAATIGNALTADQYSRIGEVLMMRLVVLFADRKR